MHSRAVRALQYFAVPSPRCVLCSPSGAMHRIDPCSCSSGSGGGSGLQHTGLPADEQEPHKELLTLYCAPRTSDAAQNFKGGLMENAGNCKATYCCAENGTNECFSCFFSPSHLFQPFCSSLGTSGFLFAWCFRGCIFANTRQRFIEFTEMPTIDRQTGWRSMRQKERRHPAKNCLDRH